ncbi:MAG: UDP-N-acetylmuramoyl-tripeptide--D-alanyl-D-alanine ligase [Candidatus Omnitrophica bacterium]|nr:UDP-N-acetylmuramoyl-tripeptide--D-alanyl-D-alanine ligase [Candidatus Omnitrophota bacterium]
MFSLSEIIQSTKGTRIKGNEDLSVKSIAIDSRTLNEGELFLAIKGDRFDGHDCIGQALERKAAGVVISSHWFALNQKSAACIDKAVVVVDNTVAALGAIAGYHRKKFDIPIIAVTGSNGKTTTKEMIYSLLNGTYSVVKSQGSFNNHIGVPLSLLNLSEDKQAGVFELGMNHKGEIRALASLVNPNIAVITSIGEAHLEFFNGISEIIDAKCELLEKLAFNGVAFINADCRSLYARAVEFFDNVIGFGIKEKCAYQASNVVCGENYVAFSLNEKYTFTLPLLGEHNVYNALAAIAVADYLKIDMQTMRERIKNFKPMTMRLEPIDCFGVKIIADCYNSNPHSAALAIRTLAGIKNKKRRIIVLADMLELGRGSEKLHYQLGEQIAHSSIEKIIAVGDRAAFTAKAALECGMGKQDVFAFNTNKEALEMLSQQLEPGDAVLFKGSRGMHLEEIIEGLKSFLEEKNKPKISG